MLKIRFHGRGGQGMKTASRILGQALFLSGYEVQDAPRYGAERRGAPIFAYVRADKQTIYDRGVISDPDLVVVADDTLLNIKAAGVLEGLQAHTQLIIHSNETAELWQDRLALKNRLVILPTHTTRSEISGDAVIDFQFISTRCAAAAAKFVAALSTEKLIEAIRLELAEFDEVLIQANISKAVDTYNDLVIDNSQILTIESSTADSQPAAATANDPAWVDLKLESGVDIAPAIHTPLTSVKINTGLWRTLRPVIDYDKCNSCWWVCSSLCPDGVIAVEDNTPVIDYDHCKGCLLCMAHCPPKAIQAEPEIDFRADQQAASQESSS